MNINQLSQEYEIEQAVKEVVKKTHDITGKEIEFELLINLDTDGSTKIARERMDKHIIMVKENNTARVNHVIAHECGHIMRMLEARPSDRKIPSINTETLAGAYRDLEHELADIPAVARKDIFERWVAGVINQLTNLPVDVRIENWLYYGYPGFRDTQRKSLAVDANNCLASLSDRVKKHTIKPIFHKSNAMVYAYLKGISHIMGYDYPSYYEGHPSITKLGEELYNTLDSESEGYAKDVAIINKWAELLDICKWFTWIGFEDVPESYYE